MLRDHGVELEVGLISEVLGEVLAVVGEVLADYFAVRVGEEGLESCIDCDLLVKRPVINSALIQERNAECLEGRPGESDAGDVTGD